MLGRLPESRRLSADQAAQPPRPGSSNFFTPSQPWDDNALPLPVPSPDRAREGCPADAGRGEGLRTQGSRPGLRYTAASRLSSGTLGARRFINEFPLHDISSPDINNLELYSTPPTARLQRQFSQRSFDVGYRPSAAHASSPSPAAEPSNYYILTSYDSVLCSPYADGGLA